MHRKTKRPLARILVDGGFMSAQNVNPALLKQMQASELPGQGLVKLGILDAAEMSAVLSIQNELNRPETAVKLAAGVRKTLGSLLMQAGQITPEHLKQALAEQKRTGEKLGEVFIRFGMLSQQQRDHLLEFQQRQASTDEYPSRLRLGEILVSAGHISRDQLDDALQKHRASGKKLGEVLIHEGYVEPHHIKRGLRIQHILLTSTLIAAISLGGMTACGSRGGQSQTGIAVSTVQITASNQGEYAKTELDLASCNQTFINGMTVIHIPPGSYTVSRTIELSSNTVLEGEGDATILTQGALFVGPRFITNDDIVNGNKNIVLRNMQIRFASPQLTGESIGVLRFYNVEDMAINNITMVVDSQMYAIDLSGQIRNATVEGCTISNKNRTSGGGIMIRSGDPLPARSTANIVIRNNRIESVSDEPIAAFGWEGLVENVRIEQNMVIANGASFGITAFGTTNTTQSGQIRTVKIMGNDIEGSDNGAIGILGGAEDVVVSENRVKDTVHDGIFIDRGSGPPINRVSISRNMIQNAGRSGIFAAGIGVVVEQNDITDCSGSGVYATAGVLVIENIISHAAPGILVDGGQQNDIRGNTLSDDDRILFVNSDGSTVTVLSGN